MNHIIELEILGSMSFILFKMENYEGLLIHTNIVKKKIQNVNININGMWYIKFISIRIQALIHLEQYSEAYNILINELQKISDLSQFKEELLDLKIQVESLLRNVKGIFKWDLLLDRLKKENASLTKNENGTYIGPLKLKQTDSLRGIGVFANKNIKQGEVVCVELAISTIKTTDYNTNLSESMKIGLLLVSELIFLKIEVFF